MWSILHKMKRTGPGFLRKSRTLDAEEFLHLVKIRKVNCEFRYKLSLGFPHNILILIQATQAGHWLIFCQPVLSRLLSYGNETDNGYGQHLRSQTELLKLQSGLYTTYPTPYKLQGVIQ